MKVLLINGSPHANGCTYRALVEVARTLEEEGVSTEIMHIGNQAIRGCQACGMCRKSETKRCIFGDDPVNVAISKMEECDGLVVGTPVHYASASGSITSFLDRFFYATGGFAHKPGAAIASCRRAGSTSALDQLNKYFMINNMPMVPSYYWNMVHGNTPSEVEEDFEGLMVMRQLGHNMAWMLKSFELMKEAGLAPRKEEVIRTNFIRKLNATPVTGKTESEYKDFVPYFLSYNKVKKEYQDED